MGCTVQPTDGQTTDVAYVLLTLSGEEVIGLSKWLWTHINELQIKQ